MIEMNAVEYTDSEAEGRTAQLTEELARKIERFDEDDVKWTKSKAMNEAIRQYFGLGELAALEREICKDLVEAGYPVPISSSYDHPEGGKSQNKIFIKTGHFQSENITKDEFNRRESFGKGFKITTECIEEVEWAANGERSKSVVYINVLTRWFGMQFKDRFDRVRSLRQLLKAYRNEEVENPTAFVQRRMQGTKLDTETEDVRVYEDLFEEDFDIGEVKPADQVELSESEVMEAHEDLKKARTNRIGVLVAVARHKDKDFWRREELAGLNDRLNHDISTDRTRAEYVDDALQFLSTGVEFSKGELQASAQEIKSSYVEQVVDRKGEYTPKGRRRDNLVEEEVEWMQEELSEFDRQYDNYEVMADDVLEVIARTFPEKGEEWEDAPPKASEFVFCLIRVVPEEMWDAPGLAGETVADDLKYELEVRDVPEKVKTAAETFAGVDLEE